MTDWSKLVLGKAAKPKRKTKKGKWSWESEKGLKRRKTTKKIKARREWMAKLKGISTRGKK